MPNPVRNADGTVQVAPPTQSAFAPQPGPAQAAPPPQAPPSSMHATPGFAGALLDAIKSLVGASAPRAIVQHKTALDNAIDSASGQPAPSDSLGEHF